MATGKKKIADLEDEILRLLSESTGSLLDDMNLVNTLQDSKTISEEVTQQLQVTFKETRCTARTRTCRTFMGEANAGVTSFSVQTKVHSLKLEEAGKKCGCGFFANLLAGF